MAKSGSAQVKFDFLFTSLNQKDLMYVHIKKWPHSSGINQRFPFQFATDLCEEKKNSKKK